MKEKGNFIELGGTTIRKRDIEAFYIGHWDETPTLEITTVGCHKFKEYFKTEEEALNNKNKLIEMLE